MYLKDIKNSLKFYKLNNNGKKKILEERLYNFFDNLNNYNKKINIDKIIFIQNIYKNKLNNKKIESQGPGIIDKTKCVNHEDFYSFENIFDLNDIYFFSYKENNNIYFFDIRSFKKLLENDGLNPYNRNSINDSIITQFNNRYNYLKNKKVNLSFEDDINGWTSFFTYEPNFVGSLKSKYYSFYDAEIYEHYDQTPGHIRSTFYGVTSNSSVEFIFNANPSIIKNFKTVNYEGSNGWQVESFLSDAEGFDLQSNAQQQYNDSAKLVRSYEEGLYTESGVPYRAGFNRKENKYFANLINNSVARPNEVFFGDATTGIKGYLATVKVSTDATTDPGGTKELFAVSTEFVVSSR